MLFKLIRLTDPCFAQYLSTQESDNCYFAFRWIICLFKREFMKGKTDSYHDCLLVWETIWAATALAAFKSSEETPSERSSSNGGTDPPPCLETTGANGESPPSIDKESGQESDSPKSSSSPERLTDAQLFVLCICLSIIRRERDLIMAQQFDACETLKHFNTLNLNASLKDILLHACTIWNWLTQDGGREQLYFSDPIGKRNDSAAEDFDLLNDDFMVVNSMNV